MLNAPEMMTHLEIQGCLDDSSSGDGIPNLTWACSDSAMYPLLPRFRHRNKHLLKGFEHVFVTANGVVITNALL